MIITWIIIVMFPFLLQPVMKTLLRSWSELYRSFARCAALVATAEDNLCCEELCAKIVNGLKDETCIVSIDPSCT